MDLSTAADDCLLSSPLLYHSEGSSEAARAAQAPNRSLHLDTKKPTTDHSFSHFSKFYLDSPARSCFKHGVCSEPGALSTAQPPFPKPFIPTRQPAALQGQWDELLRGEAAEPHEAPSQTQGAGGLCSASALCEVQIEVAMCAA